MGAGHCMKPQVYVFLYAWATLFVLPFSFAVGVGIFVEEVSFYSNLNENYQAFVNNNGDKPVRVALLAEGELAQYVTFSEKFLEVGPSGRSWFTYNLKLPETIPPGRNKINIGVEEVSSPGGVGIVAKTAAYYGIFINAPYAGKYLKGSMSIPPVKVGEKALISFSFTHQGNETIDSLKGSISIFNKTKEGSLITKLSFPPIRKIVPRNSTEATVPWDLKGVPVGDYYIVADLDYDGHHLAFEQSLRIGDLVVKVINYTSEFLQEGISRMDILVRSFWNDPIERVYGEISLGELRLKTPESTIQPWEQGTLTTYLDTLALPPGQHPFTLTLTFAEKTSLEHGMITLVPKVIQAPSPPKVTIPMTTILLIGVVGLLALINVFLILFYFRSKKRSNGSVPTPRNKHGEGGTYRK